ncbi:MAG TPA: GNAT family N-acetyltransferase [Patescibacteria group bacterium]|nr:GNAT family N-acetyltransferase [Patescibacteria group bacterium]
MATSALSSVAVRTMTVRLTTDRGLLRSFLERDRLFAAYALCDLDVREFAKTRWGVALANDEPIAVVLEYAGYAPQPLFAMGENAGIEAILREVIRPRSAYAAALPASLPAFEASYRVEPAPQMVRMWVDRASFRPFPAAVARLLPVEIGDLNRLYQLGFTAWLPPSAIAEGAYYGIRVAGRLVSAAGTHVVSPEARLGVVGNVMTQADYRGRGYATAATGAVTSELLRFCDQVVLNVRADNPPALQAYRRLGYREHVRFEERLVHRLPAAGGLARSLAAPFRRLFGRGAGPRA